jgi:Family of unknown function (DUF6527)
VSRRTQIQHRYVEFIPKDLDEGILYISTRFKTASHLCCCGCGSKVVTPLNPARWQLVDHHSTVSLSPSIGLGALPCRSHYWIRRSCVDWYPNMTDAQTDRAAQADRYASQVYTGERLPIPPSPKHTSIARTTIDRWRQLIGWFRSLFR